MGGFVGIDYGSARAGLASAPADVRIASAVGAFAPHELVAEITRLAPDVIVVGLPRNLDGADTPQTLAVRRYAADVLTPLASEIVFQDEAGTSSVAEEHLKSSGKPYERGDIDAQAAALILQDYLDSL